MCYKGLGYATGNARRDLEYATGYATRGLGYARGNARGSICSTICWWGAVAMLRYVCKGRIDMLYEMLDGCI